MKTAFTPKELKFYYYYNIRLNKTRVKQFRALLDLGLSPVEIAKIYKLKAPNMVYNLKLYTKDTEFSEIRNLEFKYDGYTIQLLPSFKAKVIVSDLNKINANYELKIMTLSGMYPKLEDEDTLNNKDMVYSYSLNLTGNLTEELFYAKYEGETKQFYRNINNGQMDRVFDYYNEHKEIPFVLSVSTGKDLNGRSYTKDAIQVGRTRKGTIWVQPLSELLDWNF
jgi:hypothetical protein